MSPMTEAILAINRLTEGLEAERKENANLRAHMKDLHEYIWKMQQQMDFSNSSATGENKPQWTEKDDQAKEELERLARRCNLALEFNTFGSDGPTIDPSGWVWKKTKADGVLIKD